MQSILQNRTCQRWGLLALTVFTFLFLLGSRALNEPDEGRYSEIAREMIETGDWLVPHLWYLPHLDKPPMTYWLVAASMRLFGQTEWAVRLPVALAGMSGVWATFLLGCALGGRRAGFWSALILQTSLLYFAMGRMLTSDIFLTQFVAWAIYFLWRSWACLTNSEFGIRDLGFFVWHLAGWAAIALGFLTKGPIALVIPLVALTAPAIFRWRNFTHKKLLFSGLVAGFLIFFALAAPWFLMVFRRVPQSEHYMIGGQAVGHLLGTAIKNRRGGPFYFIGILAAGLLPWTWLLGWLWRRSHWRGLAAPQRDGWLLLNVWAILTFVLFSFSRAKLPAYILPMFPALAILLAWRLFGDEGGGESALRPAWRLCLMSSLLLPAILPLLLAFVFHDALPGWLIWQTPVTALIVVLLLWRQKNLKPARCAGLAAGLTLLGLMVTLAEIPPFETSLRSNQTLKPLAIALRENYRPGDTLICWGRLPQGLPFYAGPVISATNRPHFGGMGLRNVPFEFPGNRERLGDLYLPDQSALWQRLAGEHHVLVVCPDGTLDNLRRRHPAVPVHLITRVGQWELCANR